MSEFYLSHEILKEMLLAEPQFAKRYVLRYQKSKTVRQGKDAEASRQVVQLIDELMSLVETNRAAKKRKRV